MSLGSPQFLGPAIIVVVHFIGAGFLIWGLIDHDDPDRGHWRDWWPRDDHDDDGPPAGPQGRPQGGMTVPVLPQSTAHGIRVREGARIGDLTPRPARRPAHPPVPAPVPATPVSPSPDPG